MPSQLAGSMPRGQTRATGLLLNLEGELAKGLQGFDDFKNEKLAISILIIARRRTYVNN